MKEQRAIIELTHDEYAGMDKIKYPIQVHATVVKKNGHIVGFYVTGKELIYSGADKASFRGSHRYFFFRENVGRVDLVEKKKEQRRKSRDVYHSFDSDNVAVACACAMSCM